MASQKTEILRNGADEPLPDAGFEFDEGFEPEVSSFSKSKVECICPGCGKIHAIKMRWIGRGVPRKFCHNCRDRETPLDGDD